MTLRAPIRLYQQRGSVRHVAPDVEPVTAAQLRMQLDETEAGLPDDVADLFIATAREEIEAVTGLALITQTWRLSLDAWPGGAEPWWNGVHQGAIAELRRQPGWVVLPVYPLLTVASVKVYDDANAETSVTVADVFDVDTYQKPGRMALKGGQTWPVALRDTNAILIEYTAGFGATATSVPAPLRQAILKMAAHLYAHRGDGCTPGDAYTASGAAAMAARYQAARI